MLGFRPPPQPSAIKKMNSRKNAHNSTTNSTVPATVVDSGRLWICQSAIEQARRSNNNKNNKIPQRRLSSKGDLLNNSSNSNHSVAETESCTDHDEPWTGRHLIWEWKEATLLETCSKNGNLTVRLLTDELVVPSDDNNNNDDSTILTLPASSWETGQILSANEYPRDAQTGSIQPPHDLITLTHLHEPSVVESLACRFEQYQIYTNTGPVLIALNPFQTLRGLYGETIQKKYWEKAEGNLPMPLPPHVYAIADASFRNMMRSLEDHLDDDNNNNNNNKLNPNASNQSILVSGESGAGKTVTTKFVMKYLAALSQRSAVLHTPEKRAYLKVAEQQHKTPPNRMSPSKTKAFEFDNNNNKTHYNQKLKIRSNSSDLALVTTSLSGNSNSIEAQVLQSNPILESFGNARTVRNDNSSRFGKFIEIQFTHQGKLVGARIDTYLLEKVRLLVQARGERNYHIFYELLSGALTDKELSKYFLAPTARPQDFKLTGMSGCFDRRDGVSDQETFRGLVTAMSTVKFSSNQVESILSVTAAILHASNLTFLQVNHDEAALDERNVHLPAVCHLLGVTVQDLSESLTAFSIQAGKEMSVRRALTVAQAEKGLEALLKTTYGALFTYLVRRINDSIACTTTTTTSGEGPAASIGVLDIFGFESFHQNSFEQLCINYCNEALQQQFNAFVLASEQAEYEREGIEWSFIEFPDNQDVLDLIEKRGTGILSILDDQCRAPGPSDKAFCCHVYNTCTSQPRFAASRKQTATLQFSVHHYAGPVEYTSQGFVEKNRDELPKETTEMLKMSESSFVKELAFIIETGREVEASGVGGVSATPSKQLHRADSSVGRATVGGQFRRQLRDLRNKIDLTTPHYVRCIKPNDLLVPDLFDKAIVAEQLRCGGILEAVRVARAGFTQHYPHADFVRRYRAVAWKELTNKKTALQSSYTPGWTSSSPRTKSSSYRNAYTARSVAPPKPEPSHKQEMAPVQVKAECQQLVKVLYRKLQAQETPEEGLSSDPSLPSSPAAKAKTYSYRSSSAPSWSKTTTEAQLPPGGSNKPAKKIATPERNESPRMRSALSSAHLKSGIQVGKTKVFLRHKCFEALERMRSIEQTKAATKLNSIFRMYLSRIAYLPFRDAFRQEFMAFANGTMFEEKKDGEDYDNIDSSSRGFRPNLFRHRGGAFACQSLVDKWLESRIRDAIHNPVPRHEWGKQGPSGMKFKWVLDDGIWVKNYSEAS